MDVALLDCGFPEAPCPVYKKGGVAQALLSLRAPESPKLLKTARPLACPPCSSASEIWPASSKARAAADGT
jgi:hypothetical protein